MVSPILIGDDYMIYHREHFIMFSCGDGYIIQNMRKDFKDGHSHLKSQRMGMTIIDNVIKGKIPKTHNNYLLRSHMRIAEDQEYINKIEQLIAVRKQKGKKRSYINRS